MSATYPMINDRKDNQEETIILDHGTGAKLSRELVEKIAEILGDSFLVTMEDSAILELHSIKIVLTKD